MHSKPDNFARTVIFDPVKQNVRATRYGLIQAGFRDIEVFNDISELKWRLDERPLDLLIAEVGDGGEIYDLVRALRRGEISENPFAVVFLTSWTGDKEIIGAALRCGADDVIIRPFSTSFIESRIRTAVEHRKKFVVTSDYLGPDRSQAINIEGGENVRRLDPPNTLRAAVNGDREQMNSRLDDIDSFKIVVRRERAVRLAVRIGVETELTALGKSTAANVLALAQQLYVAVEEVDPEAAKLAASIVRGLSEGQDEQKGLKLAHELAVGICVICGEGEEGPDGGAQYVSEITDLVGSLKERRSEAA